MTAGSVQLSDPLLTVEQVCEALGRKKSTVFPLLKSGELKSTKIGNSRRVRQSWLEEYIAALPVIPGGRTEPTATGPAGPPGDPGGGGGTGPGRDSEEQPSE